MPALALGCGLGLGGDASLLARLLALGPEALWIAGYGETLADFWGSLTNVAAVGTSITKTSGGSAWNASGVTGRTIPGNGYVEFSTGEVDKIKAGGLSVTNPSLDYTGIQFGIYIEAGQAVVIESGTSKGLAWNCVADGVFRIDVAGSTVRYYYRAPGAAVPGTLQYTSLVSPAGPMLFDSSLYTVGATINNVTLSGDYPNVSALADLTGHGHNMTQATLTHQPLLVPGATPYLRFARARGDNLGSALLGLPVGSYTLASIIRFHTPPTDYELICTEGESSGTGLYAYTGGVNRGAAHYGVGDYEFGAVTATREAWIVRFGSGNIRARVSGVDQTPAALSNMATPLTFWQVGGYPAGSQGANIELSLLAAFSRSLSTADTDALDTIFSMYCGIP